MVQGKSYCLEHLKKLSGSIALGPVNDHVPYVLALFLGR